MITVSATEFSKNFGRYRDTVQREPIAVTSHGRVTGYFLSGVEYEALMREKAPISNDYMLPHLPQNVSAHVEEEESEEETAGFLEKIKTQMRDLLPTRRTADTEQE